jgi:hypothetical protein
MLIFSPQFSNIKSSYKLENQKLTISIDGIEEVFDFSVMPDGILEHVEVEILPINPILSAKKSNGILEIIVIKFYDDDEKMLYEVNHEN